MTGRKNLRTDKFDRGLSDFEGPFVGIIDTAIASRLEGIVTRAPGPQTVATLHQVIDDHVVVPGQIIGTIPALTVAGGFIQVKRNSDWLSCRVHDANDCGSSAWRSQYPRAARINVWIGGRRERGGTDCRR